MKRFKKAILASIISASFLSSSIAMARGWDSNSNSNRGPRYSQQQNLNFMGPGRLLRSEMNEAQVEVLAELSGQSKESIQTKLQNSPMWSVFNELKIDRSDFQNAMHEKMKIIVEQAIEKGDLTQEQGNLMLSHMEGGPYMPVGPGFQRGMGSQGKGYGMGYRNSDYACGFGNGNSYNRNLNNSQK